MSSTSKSTAGSTGATPATQPVGLPELSAQPLGQVLMGAHAGLLDSVKVSLSVVVGQAHITLGELMGLKESALLKIERAVDAPIEVLVNGNVVARGQLVAVDDNFGVRITEIAQPVQG